MKVTDSFSVINNPYVQTALFNIKLINIGIIISILKQKKNVVEGVFMQSFCEVVLIRYLITTLIRFFRAFHPLFDNFALMPIPIYQ